MTKKKVLKLKEIIRTWGCRSCNECSTCVFKIESEQSEKNYHDDRSCVLINKHRKHIYLSALQELRELNIDEDID